MRGNIIMVGIVVVAVLMTGCATTSTRTTTTSTNANTKEGAGIGAIVGGVAGALIDKDNPWRGGVIGAAAGALIGGTVGHIRDRAAEEAAAENREVQYTRTYDDGTREVVRATPSGYSDDGNYKLVTTEVIRDGVVVETTVKRVPIN
jgi:outer membrane lipoprotein SlyB